MEENTTLNVGNIRPILIEEEMSTSYIDYSMSVIAGRALPDARDGLKPVHRRVLFAMRELGNTHNRPYKKSARVVGDVIGKYHPHGDTAVYDTIVRMAQDWAMRAPLVDGQGNFGSRDGDSAAAMRYTEVRMDRHAEELLEDIDKDTVDFGPNYDESLTQPLVLPAKLPNLLLNGSTGIAVGMATNIPPHNLGELVDGILMYIDNPDCSVEDLMQHIKGPDFPTYGVVCGFGPIRQMYQTGRGLIRIRGRANVEQKKNDREVIIVTELPYTVNKAKLIENIADLVQNKHVFLVNVDPGENLRFHDANIHPIEADLAVFFQTIAKHSFKAESHADWLHQVNKVKATLTIDTEAQMRTTVGQGYLSAYDITTEISRTLPKDATVVLGISLDAHTVFNSFLVTKGQRVLVSRNLGPMGWDVPALLGAAHTTKQHDALILLTGDGSLMLNIQELAVIAGLAIPACIFVFNNDGYVSIRTTQSNFFGQQFFGCDAASGLKIPAIAPLAHGFGFAYSKVSALADIQDILSEHHHVGKPRIVECSIDPSQLREPRLVSRVQNGQFKTPVLHDMTPSLTPALGAVVVGMFPQAFD